MRYRVKPWTYRHHPNAYHAEARDEEGVMLFTKGHAFFIAGEQIYNVANAIVDTLETMEGENG